MSFTVPAPVADRKTVVAPAQKKRTGLIPMAPHSQHNLTIKTVEGEEQTIACIARPREDAPKAKVKFICLHEHCAGKEWADVGSMHDAHPQRSVMERRQEAHVYGLWSDDPHDPKAQKAADTALQAAEKALAKASEKDKAAAEFAVEQAKAQVQKAAGVLGLIAPPEARVEE